MDSSASEPLAAAASTMPTVVTLDEPCPSPEKKDAPTTTATSFSVSTVAHDVVFKTSDGVCFPPIPAWQTVRFSTEENPCFFRCAAQFFQHRLSWSATTASTTSWSAPLESASDAVLARADGAISVPAVVRCTPTTTTTHSCSMRATAAHPSFIPFGKVRARATAARDQSTTQPVPVHQVTVYHTREQFEPVVLWMQSGVFHKPSSMCIRAIESMLAEYQLALPPPQELCVCAEAPVPLVYTFGQHVASLGDAAPPWMKQIVAAENDLQERAQQALQRLLLRVFDGTGTMLHLYESEGPIVMNISASMVRVHPMLWERITRAAQWSGYSITTRGVGSCKTWIIVTPV